MCHSGISRFYGISNLGVRDTECSGEPFSLGSELKPQRLTRFLLSGEGEGSVYMQGLKGIVDLEIRPCSQFRRVTNGAALY